MTSAQQAGSARWPTASTHPSRMGVCQAAPCNCVYIDRSRARTRRYCCDQCNDRASIAAYRRRQSGKHS